ncbi:Fc.00g072970.m01.CDS01 [Cosmosporella sp. VM-42]
MVLVGLAVLLYHPVIELYTFKHTDRIDSLTQWSNHSRLNSQNCTVHYEADACEDISVHWATSTAFIACGDPLERTLWYPPSLAYNASGRSEASFREKIFKYDIKTEKSTRLRIDGLGGDFVNHGIDVYEFPDDPTKIHLFAVNHRRSGDSILILSHSLGSDSVQVVKEVVHPSIKNPNGVAAIGPLSEFFITNDHYFTPGFLRTLEDKFGPWPWATDVQYCDANDEVPVCRLISPRQPGFNGIAISQDKQRLFVGDSKMAKMHVFNISESRKLSPVASVALGAAADNIHILPTTGDPIISVFANIEDLPHYLSNVRGLGRDLLVPSAALLLREKNGYQPELVYWDDGSVLSYMTVAIIDPYNHVFIGGSVLQYGGFTICELPNDFLTT